MSAFLRKFTMRATLQVVTLSVCTIAFAVALGFVFSGLIL